MTPLTIADAPNLNLARRQAIATRCDATAINKTSGRNVESTKSRSKLTAATAEAAINEASARTSVS